MADIILAKEIEAEFTAKVNEYLGKGMRISTSTMVGHQGELCKVDLTDGNNIYRIRLDRKCCLGENGFYGDKITMIVEKFDEFKRNIFDSFTTLWTGSGEDIEITEWFDISGNKSAFVKNLEEAVAMQDLHHSRSKNHDRFNFNNTKTVNIILTNDEQRTLVRDMVRRVRGYGRVKRAEIVCIEKMVYSNGIQYKAYFTTESGKAPMTFKQVKF